MKIKNKNKIAFRLALVAGIFFLGACDMYDEGILTDHRVQVEKGVYNDARDISEIDSAYLTDAAARYRKNGDGPFDLAVTYDPESFDSAALAASEDLQRIVAGLRANGVENVRADILPVRNEGEARRAMIHYTSYEAHAAEDCGVMPGMNGRPVAPDENYRLGCTLDGLYAKQAANLRDLAKSAGSENSDGRRAANVVERYRAGEPNTPLEGEKASSD